MSSKHNRTQRREANRIISQHFGDLVEVKLNDAATQQGDSKSDSKP